jgi:hypothetical protein
VSYVPELRDRYPGMAVVMMVRGAVETIHSLLAKHVFTEGHPSAALPWPFRFFGEARIPYWVKHGDEALWKELNEIDRCAYYYICMSENVEAADRQLVLKYSDLVKSPLEVAHRLADFLGVKFGNRTAAVIDAIRPMGANLLGDVINSISEMFRWKVIDYSKRAE